MKNNILIIFVSIFISSWSISQNSCSSADPGCVIPDFTPTTTGQNAPELVGNNISNPTTNPNTGNAGCLISGCPDPNWFTISVVADGPLTFELGANGGSGFYDWALWKATPGVDICGEISGNTLAPVACNWNGASAGFTGMAPTGNLPTGGVASNFENSLMALTGEEYMLVFSNYTGGGNDVDVNFSDNVSCTPYLIPDQTICIGETATISVPQTNTNGDALNITGYSWSPAISVNSPLSGPDVIVSPTSTTTYTVTLTSPDSLTTWTQTAVVNVIELIQPDAGLDDSLCRQSSSASYQLQGVPSIATNTTTWEYSQGPTGTPGTPNAIFQPNSPNNLNANTLTNYPGLYEYVLHEVDANGVCPDGTDTVKIFFSKESHTTASTDPTCFGDSDGTITITSTGDLPTLEYSFDNGVTFQANNTITNASAGNNVDTIYTIVTKNIIGCTETSTVTITNPLAIVLTVGPTPDSTVCENGTATLYASAINGTTYAYHWIDLTNDLGHTQTISPIASAVDTTVRVYAVSELGCISDTLPIKIKLYAPISLVITANDTICPGFDASHKVEAVGGFGNYNYVWTANTTAYNDFDSVININPTVETEYCVTVTDACETTPKSICTKIIMREVPMPYFITDTIEGCNPKIIKFSDSTFYSLSETETVHLNWLVDGAVYHDSLFDHLFENVGEFDVQLEVITQYGCYNTLVASEYISIHEVPVANFYVISNPTTIFNTMVEMINNTQGDNLTFQWDNTGGTPASSNLESPTVLYPEGIAKDYPVNLIVTNEFNCIGETKDVVHVVSDVIIYAPNAFTPDGDELNNDWRVYIDGINVNDYHLMMFNRFGEVVWESYDPEGVWDGTYTGRENGNNTFIWRLVVKDGTNDKKYEFKGHVTILK